VSKFTEYDAKKLYKLYKHEVKKEQGGSEKLEKNKDGERDKQKEKKKERHDRKRKNEKTENLEGVSPNKKPHVEG